MDAETNAKQYQICAEGLLYPGRQSVEMIKEGQFKNMVTEAFGNDFCNDNKLEFSALQSSGELLRALRVEHTRLFIGSPFPKVSHYESQFRGSLEGRESLLFIDEITLDIKEMYKKAGIARREDNGEPEDFIVSICEFAGHLLMSSEKDYFEILYKKHIESWFFDFSKALHNETQEAYYLILSGLLESTVTSSRHLFRK